MGVLVSVFLSVTYYVTVEFFRPKWLCTDLQILRGFPGLFGFKGFGVRFVGRGGTEKDEEIIFRKKKDGSN